MNKGKKNVNIEIGKKLRALRLRKDVSEIDVALAIKRNPSTYSRYESGTYHVSDIAAELLADYFEVDVNEIKPPQPTVNNENSFNESPSSGNFNTIVIPESILNSFFEAYRQTTQANSQLMSMTIENQKTLIENQKILMQNQMMIMAMLKK